MYSNAMNRILFIVVAVVCLLSSSVNAQGFMGVSGKIEILLIPTAKKELKITKEQDKAIQLAMKDADKSENLAGLDFKYPTKNMDAKLDAVLNDEQRLRMKQLWYQRNGYFVLQLSEPAAELKLTDEQASQVATICSDKDSAAMELISGGKVGSNIIKKMKAVAKEYEVKIAAILTEEQKTAWTTLIGKPFRFPN